MNLTYALSYSNVYALSSYSLLIFHAFFSRPACHIHVPWCHTLQSLLTMYVPCIDHEKPISLNVILSLDSKSFQTALDFSRPMTSCHVTSQSCALSLSCYRLIIILLLYLICPNPNPKVYPHFCLITVHSWIMYGL